MAQSSVQAVTANMVAARKNFRGTTAQAAVSQYLASHTAIPEWRPREGRSDNFTLWQDAFGDALADLGLTLASISDMPPPKPLGPLSDQGTYELWVNAIDQYQLEGTALFDMVRSSLDVSGAHQEQDLRRISAWKRNGVKDGRALIRWALGFVDRSSVEAQMALQTEINAMRLSTSETLLGLEKHLYKLFNLWLALGNSDRGAYNSFFCLLLLTMPATPECPIVHVRRYLVDTINKQNSPLLTDVDGDEGLFVAMIAYGKALGLKDTGAAALGGQLSMQLTDTPAGGVEKEKRKKKVDKDKDEKEKSKCDTCYSFACTEEARGNGGCICKWNSKYDLSKAPSKGKQDYIKLLRAYNKANPDATLKVKISLVREAIGSSPSGTLTFLKPVKELLGCDIDEVDELEAWLSDHAGSQSFFALGATDGPGSLQFHIGPETPAVEELNESGNMTSSGSSARSVTDAESAMASLQAQLDDAHAQVLALQTQPRFSATPSAHASVLQMPVPALDQPVPNPALDRAVPLSMQMTPGDLYRNAIRGNATRSMLWSSSRRQPLFSPAPNSIAEHGDAASGGGEKEKKSASEIICSGVVAMEKEKRKLEDKLKEKQRSNYVLLRILSRVLLASGGCVSVAMTIIGNYCSELTLHQLSTLSLLLYSTSDKITPLLKKAFAKLSLLMLSASISKTRSMLLRMRASVIDALRSLLARVLSSQRVLVPVSTVADGIMQATHNGFMMMNSETWPTAADDGNMQLSGAVMLASMEIANTTGTVPALMDNGASNGTSCSRTTDGAVAGTFRASDACEIGLGSQGATLSCKGSWLYVLHRFGKTTSEIVVRRLKYTPDLPMPIVFSEASENVEHGYSIDWPAGEGRRMTSPKGGVIELHMSKTNLGWLKVSAITCPDKQRKIMEEIQSRGGPRSPSSKVPPSEEPRGGYSRPDGPAVGVDLEGGGEHQLSVKAFFDPAVARGVNMGKPAQLRGVALLRRQHCKDGHPALPVTVRNLQLQGAFEKKLITFVHVKLFAEQGCGTCDNTKMRRRAFTLRSAPLDRSEPKLGKCWVIDVLSLRVPSAHNGATLMYIAVEKVSGYAMTGFMRSYTEADFIAALNEIKARVRPEHNEINVVRLDHHPTHNSRGVRDYMIENQQRMQLSPPYVHEGVGIAEAYFLHAVPSANALLSAAPDLSENHFGQAFRYVVRGRNHSVSSKSSPPRSPAMIYYGSETYLDSGLMVFGSAAMALVHGEARDSKFDEHAKACIYVGPAFSSDSSLHCAVFHETKYVDVDSGCISVNETVPIDRTHRSHSSTQPFNQVAGSRTVDIGMPALFDLVGHVYTEDEQPNIRPIVWVRSMLVPTEWIALLLWHGELRAGDMAAWVYELGANRVVPLPIDIKVGGQEHNLERGPVKHAVLDMFKRDNVLGGFLQPECGPYTAMRFAQPGPPVLFDLEHVDGIPGADGELPHAVTAELNNVVFVAGLFRATADTDKVLCIEYPAGQGVGSPFAAKGRELHSTIGDTSIMRTVASELGLIVVYTEQGASGAKTRKPTALMATPGFANGLMRTVGALHLPAGALNDVSLLGTNANGDYKSAGSQVYTSTFAMRLAIAFVGSMPRLIESLEQRNVDIASAQATDDLYPVGTIIEIYWHGDKAWYAGVVLDSRVRKGGVHGRSIERREIKVRYAADDKVLWHAICDYNMREQSDDISEPDDNSLSVLSLLHERRPIRVRKWDDCDKEIPMSDNDFLANMHDADDTDPLEEPNKCFEHSVPTVPTSSLEPLAHKDPPNPNPSGNPNQPPDYCDQTPACGWATRADGSFDGWDCYCPEPSPQHELNVAVHNAVDDIAGSHAKSRINWTDSEHAAGRRLPATRPRQVKWLDETPTMVDLRNTDAGLRNTATSSAAANANGRGKGKGGRGGARGGKGATPSPDPRGPPPAPPIGVAMKRDVNGRLEPINVETFHSDFKAEKKRKHSMLLAHAGEVLATRQALFDMVTHELVDNSAVFVVLDNSDVELVDTTGSHTWHVPANEREYNMSPQRALWRTAKELKMDDYTKINSNSLVLRSSVDLTKHTIYQTMWAYKIKYKGLIFDKLNPRWCVRGGSMDRDVFKSYAEMMRTTSLNILWGIAAEFYDELAKALMDLKDAFQSTATVDADGNLKEGENELFTEQAPGFKKYGPNGEELVCRQNCYMQGRIDSTAGFDKRLMQIITKSAFFYPLLWDPKVLVYNTTGFVGSTATLREIIADGNKTVADNMDSAPQQAPYGWAVIGQHVDDLLALATGKSYKENRILAFIRGEIASTYACKLTGWHGEKMLGFEMSLNDELKTITITAQGALHAIRQKLFTKDQFKTTPRHIVTEAVFEHSPGNVPEVGDPARDAYLDRQSTTRSVLGAGIWLSLAYPQIASGINSMCVDMANPSDERLGQLRHMFMNIGPSPPGKTFGGPNVTSICSSDDEVAPFTAGSKEGRYHYFSDASIGVTGGIGMFAGACIQQLCLRQHLQSPCAHTSEVVAGGTNMHAIIPVNGVLQELSIRQGRSTTTYFDSISTVFVASSDAAPKKSVWLARRTKVITETTAMGETAPVHISEKDMVADSCTKYIKHDTWARHMHYILNLPGDPPDCHDAGWTKATATKNKKKGK